MNWYVIGQAATGTPPGASGASGGGGMINMVLMFGGIFLIFYFLLIRPQRKQEKQRQAMLKELKKNDKVVTIGGIYGVVVNVRDKDVTLKIDDSKDVRVRFTRTSVSHVISKEEDEQESAQQ
mgnify:CR=1 FL=1